jgi:hypothetical protein
VLQLLKRLRRQSLQRITGSRVWLQKCIQVGHRHENLAAWHRLDAPQVTPW